MPFELVSEADMAVKSKKAVDTKKIKDVTKSIDIQKVEDIKDAKGVEDVEKIEKGIDVKNADAKNVDTKNAGPKIAPILNPNIIVKRIYFPEDTYSKKENQTGFKKILAKYGLAWYKPMMKTYTSKEGVSVLTGLYASADQNKKVFCIYEGTGKPTTVIVKIIGSGGNFLIDLGSFCHGAGCIIEDKDEMFINNTLLTLQEKGEIYVEKKVEEAKIEDYQKIFEEKVKKLVDEYVQKYIEDNKEILEKRGISLETALFFKKKEIEESVRWGLESGSIKL